jgi:hypothetical protein
MKHTYKRYLFAVVYASLGAILVPGAAVAQTASPTPSVEPAPIDDPGPQPIYRFWSPRIGNAHFYTMDEGERDNLKQNYNYANGGDWVYEGEVFKADPAVLGACKENQVPVHRFWNPNWGAHFYTSDGAEYYLFAHTAPWQYDGLAYCAETGEQGVSGPARPLHRFWSGVFKKYFYTASETERANVAKDSNWSYEGIVHFVH